METSISTLRSDLDKTNLSLQHFTSKKSKLDKILGAQIIGNKYQRLRLAKYVSTPKIAASISKLAPKMSANATYDEKVKISPTKCSRQGQNKYAIRKVITTSKVRTLALKRSIIGYDNNPKVHTHKFMPICHHCSILGHIRPHC